MIVNGIEKKDGGRKSKNCYSQPALSVHQKLEHDGLYRVGSGPDQVD